MNEAQIFIKGPFLCVYVHLQHSDGLLLTTVFQQPSHSVCRGLRTPTWELK